MKFVAAILLVAVFVRHGMPFQIAAATEFTPAAVSYMLGGLLEVTMACVIAALISMYRRGVWRNLALAACAVAMLEGFQMFACRAVIGDITQLPPGATLCDFAIGLPVGTALFGLYLVIICYMVGSAMRWDRSL